MRRIRNSKGRLRAPFLLIADCDERVDAIFPENLRIARKRIANAAGHRLPTVVTAPCPFEPRRTRCITIVLGGTSMSLDTSTLYLVATMVAAMLGAMLLFFGKQENIPALKWWGTAYLLGAASVALVDAGRRHARRDAFAGAECGRLRRLRHGLERLARVPRPQAQSAGTGARRHRLDRRRHDAGAGSLRAAHDHRRRHRRDLCRADRHRIVVRAPPDAAKALAGDRGAGAARLRADAADPARRPPAPAGRRRSAAASG